MALLHARAHTPKFDMAAASSASASSGLDPESVISGTSYSSQGYEASISMPLSGGANASLTTSATTSTTNSTLRGGGEGSYTFAGTGISLSYSQPLPVFRNEWALTDGKRWAAEINVRQAELALAAAKHEVVEQTLQTFFAAVRAQREADIAHAAAQQMDELLRIAREKSQLGKLAEIESLEAQVVATRTHVSAQSADASAASAYDVLKDLLGIGLDEEIQVTCAETHAAAPLPACSELLAEAMADRIDLQQTALNLRLAELSLEEAEAASRPGVSLTGGYGLFGQAPSISACWGRLNNPSWSVGLATSFDLTSREGQADIALARQRLRLGRVSYQCQQDAARLEVRGLVRRVDQAASAAGRARGHG